MTAVMLFTAAGIAAPLFVVMVVVVLIPWVLWGFSTTTKRLHDRGRSAWWLVVFYLVAARSANSRTLGGLAEPRAWCFHYILAVAAFALTTFGFAEIGCQRSEGQGLNVSRCP